jgi:ribose transport system permease protein
MKDTSNHNGNLSSIKKIFSYRETTVGFIVLLLLLTMVFTTGGKFANSNNIRATLLGLSADGIVAIAMTFVLISGGIDLSVGSVIGLTAMAAAGLVRFAGLNIWIAGLIALILAIGVGTVNGFLISKIRLNPMIATIGTMTAVRGLAMVICKGSTVQLGKTGTAFRFLGAGNVTFIPMFTIIMVILAIIAEWFLKNSVPVRKIFYTGSNETATRLSGINTSRVKFITHVFCSFLCGVTGILYLSRFNVAVVNAGTGTEMRVIAACVIGGASLVGGEGTVLGAILGTLLMNLVSNGLVLWNVSVYFQDLISGLILLLAVTIDAVSHMRRKTRVL